MVSRVSNNTNFTSKKENMEEYKELFAALLKIRDKDLQARVIKAINIKESVSIGIQVDMSLKEAEVIDLKLHAHNNTNTCVSLNTNCDYKSDSDSAGDSDLYLSSANRKSKIISIGKKVKLGRAKKRNVPYAIKEDPSLNTKIVQKYPKKRKLIAIADNQESKQLCLNSDNNSIIQNTDILNLLDEMDHDKFDIDTVSLDSYGNFKISDRIMQEAMEADWNNCLKYIDGYLNIHTAVFDEDSHNLKRQCITLQIKIGHINVITEEEKISALEIALIRKSKIEIIEILLQYNINIYHQNVDGNNALHLAILYSADINIINLLLKNVPLEKLCIINDEGYSILHLAVKQNNLFAIKSIIEHIDNLLNLENSTVKITDAKDLFDFFKDTTNASKCISMNYKNEARMKILDQKDRKSGRTPLFHALLEENEIITLYLLYNGCDPRIEDLSGTDSTLFATENINNKVISFAITKRLQYFMKSSKKTINNYKGKHNKNKTISLNT